MTIKERNNLHKMQRQNPTRDKFDTFLPALWEIGDLANIPHECCYQEMLFQIMLSSEISIESKQTALSVFERYVYLRGRYDERFDVCIALGVYFYE